MKHSKVTECTDAEQVRDSLMKLFQNIMHLRNRNGTEIEIPPVERCELEYFSNELRRLMSFFV